VYGKWDFFESYGKVYFVFLKIFFLIIYYGTGSGSAFIFKAGSGSA
jgi:hypothetical protein